jgi:hypothetical protein
MSLGEALEVPILWLWAEKMAEDMIVASEGRAPQATFEFRATRDVLTLTLLLADVHRSSADLPVDCLELTRDHLSVTPRWLVWCGSRLDAPNVAAGASDIRLARDAWRWLRRSRLLAGPCTVPELLAQCVSWRFGCRAGSVQVVRLLYLTCAVPN